MKKDETASAARADALARWGVIAVALLASVPIFAGAGILNTRSGGDSPFLLQRVFELSDGLRAGVFPVRWMAHANYGFGYPFFNFYAALPYYLSAAANLAIGDIVRAIQVTQLAGMIAAGLAMYAFVRQSLAPPAAMLAAAAYIVAPFHLANVFVRGDSLSEFWAFVWYPAILHALWRATRRDASLWTVPALAACVAGLVLTHNVSAMLFVPFIVAEALHRWIEARAGWRAMMRLAAAAMLAAALSAWFWFPALAESGMVQLQNQTTGYFNYAQHFRSWDLVQRKWLFDYAIGPQVSPFLTGQVQLIAAIAGACIGLLVAKRRDVVVALVLSAVATLLITPISKPAWDAIAPLQLAQFPWRFLSIQAFGLAWLTGHIAAGSLAWPAARAALAAALIVGVNTARLPNQRLDVASGDVTAANTALYEWASGNIGTTIRAEYLPAPFLPRPFTGDALISHGNPNVVRIRNDAAGASWRIGREARESRIVLPMTHAAGLAAFDQANNPLPLSLDVGSGLTSVETGADTTSVRIERETTGVQRAAELTSLAACLLITAALLRQAIQKPPSIDRLLLSAGVAGLLLVAARQWPTAQSAPALRTLDFASRPYPHRALLTFTGDGQAPYVLTGLSFERELVQAGERIGVTARWLNDRAPDRFELRAQFPGGGLHLGGAGARMFRYEAPRTLVSRSTVMEISPRATAGPVLLSPVASHGGTSLVPISPEGDSDYVPFLVGPTVTSSAIIPSIGAPLRRLNETLEMVSFDWLDVDSQRICFRPTWLTRTRIDSTYQLSIRMRDATGAEVARVDSQPQGGFFPTWAWPVNGLVKDAYCDAPKTRPLQADTAYSMDVIMYRVADGFVLGSTTVQGEWTGFANQVR